MSTKKKKRFIKRLFIALALVLVVYLIYKGYERWPSQNWKEYRSLVRIWPRLKKEKIESIRFTQPMTAQAGLENETFFQEIVTTFSFRVRKEDDINSWIPGFEVPKENLPECIKIIDKAMKGTSPSWGLGGNSIWLGRMLIVTDKGKYIVHVETGISKVARSRVYGEEWTSYELGKFLVQYCFHEHEYQYVVPPKEQTVAILLVSQGTALLVSPPVALFGDKELAEKRIYVDRNEAEKAAGRSLEPKMLFEGRVWLEKVVDAYEIAAKKAQEKKKEEKEAYYPGDIHALDARIVFITRDGFYWKGIGISDNTVYDDYIESEQLKAYFDELGLVKELLAEKPSKVSQN